MSTQDSSRAVSRTTAAPQKSPKKKKKSTARRLWSFFFIVLMFAAAVGSVALAWFVYDISQTLPSDEEILSYQANEASIVYDRKNRVIAELYVENRKPIKLDEVSRWMVMAILAAEDSEFYSHAGIRPLAILRSILSGDRGQGASTITQQLARNLFLTKEKSLTRKAKEAVISLRMERLYTKDKLIETYLNAIYFGHGAWGIDAAAHSYFNKSASALSLAEASVLAGLVAAPEKYSPIRYPDRATVRQNYVLGRMVHLGWATQEEADAAAQEKLTFNERTVENKLQFNQAPYFVSHILFKELIPAYGSDRVYKSGMRIMTTLDLDLQLAAENAMKELKSEGGLVAIDPETGAVLALVGGKDFDGTKFNRVTQALRQSGSAFKPVLYTTAMESGYLPIDHIMDLPITLEVPNSVDPIWSPRNFSEEFAGEETLLEALARSHNTPVARLAYLLGPANVVDTGRRMGITSPHFIPTLSIGLGVTSVTPLEMSVVYSVFANGGMKITPYFINEIRSKEGNILVSTLPQKTQAVAPEAALMVRSMLQEVIRSGTGARARMKGYEVFGKTGTTNSFTDAWFAGGVPGLVTVVYAGNDDLKPLGNGRNATGARIALPVWSAFVKEAVKILNTPKSFPETDANLASMRVCIKSGYLAAPECKNVTDILMPSDRVPSTYCPMHGSLQAPSDAQDDSNAPRLLLLPQDQATLIQSGDILPAESETSGDISADEVSPHDTAMPKPLPADKPAHQMTEKPQTPPVSPNWRQNIKKDDRSVDERYEALLKKYNLESN
ncbi:MAG: PBP1A family penicillin-binding protein [Pyramidobacter sp.]|nr:PBP1A family penicillin-binding protein [Pyramidobacter sp.]